MRAWVAVDNFINAISPVRWISLLVGVFFCAVHYHKLMEKHQWTDGPNGRQMTQALWPYKIYTFGWAYHVKLVLRRGRWERSYRRWFYANSGQGNFIRYTIGRIVSGEKPPPAWKERRK